MGQPAAAQLLAEHGTIVGVQTNGRMAAGHQYTRHRSMQRMYV